MPRGLPRGSLLGVFWAGLSEDGNSHLPDRILGGYRLLEQLFSKLAIIKMKSEGTKGTQKDERDSSRLRCLFSLLDPLRPFYSVRPESP